MIEKLSSWKQQSCTIQNVHD